MAKQPNYSAPLRPHQDAMAEVIARYVSDTADWETPIQNLLFSQG